MMIFSVTIQKMRPYAAQQARFNEYVRAALHAAALYWIRNFLPLHFEPQASQRYQYAARTERTRRIKRKAQIAYNYLGQAVPRPKPPAPLVWAGDIKKAVLGRQPESFPIKAIATSGRQRVQVPIQTPHIISAKNRGEMTRLINEEFAVMHRVASDSLRQQMAQDVTTTTEHI